MSRLNFVLLMALIASSLVLVRAAYDARQLRAELHRAEQESLRLEGERKQHEAERQHQATSMRVDKSARERLQMRPVSPAVTMYESLGTAPLAQATPGAAAAAAARVTAPETPTAPPPAPTSVPPGGER